MKTIAQQLNIKEFPFEIKDKDGNVLYQEDIDGYRARWEYDIITIEGIKYKSIEQ